MLPKLCHAERRRTLMKHSMAVRANGNEVPCGIDGIVAPNLRQRFRVVDVNESDTELAKARCKIESANSACRAEMNYARFACGWVALIRVDCDSAERAFPKALRRSHFFCQSDRRIAARKKEVAPDFL